MPRGCPHPEWLHVERSGPLVCVGCGLMWPGHELPTPYHEAEGYGEVASNKSWRSRVEAMVSELQEVS